MMARFAIGARVIILPTIFSRYTGSPGQVTRVMAHRTGKQSLDKYEIALPGEKKAVFWDIQLAPLTSKGKFAATKLEESDDTHSV
jgi:hypothetical protein